MRRARKTDRTDSNYFAASPSTTTATTAALKPARYGVNMVRLEAPSFYIDSKA